MTQVLEMLCFKMLVRLVWTRFLFENITAVNVSDGLQTVKPAYSWLSSCTNRVVIEMFKKKVLGRCAYYYYYLFVYGAWGSVVVKALRYKSVESRWCHLIFQ